MLLPLPSYHSPSLSLPSFQATDAALFSSPASQNSLKQAIDALTPSGEAVYLHGSNSASLSTFSPEHPEQLRGCLLSLADLNQEGITTESGEQSSALFSGAYEEAHQGVSAFKYQSGWNDRVLEEVGSYCSYNTTQDRYPVLYVISQNAGFEELSYGESQSPRIHPGHLLGILVPTKHLEDASAKIVASGLSVRVGSMDA